MSLRRVWLAIPLLTVALAACAPSAEEVRTIAPADEGAPPQGARGEACGINRQTLQTAIDAYLVMEGDPPADQQALVDLGLIREPVPGFTIVSDGVTATPEAAPGGDCS